MSSDHEWRPGLVWIGLDWIVFSRLVLPCVSICNYQGTCESTNNSPDEVLCPGVGNDGTGDPSTAKFLFGNCVSICGTIHQEI